MPHLTSEGLRIVTDVATRHGVSPDVALTLLGALDQGNGRQGSSIIQSSAAWDNGRKAE